MADDEFNFDFENSLEPPQNHQQVSSSNMEYHCCGALTQASMVTASLCLQNGSHIAPDLPPGAPIGQSIGNYKKNYRQVWQSFYTIFGVH